MLQKVLENIHNMFIKTPNPGTYTIEEGSLPLPFLNEGQRFWIVGSTLNDGVYTYHADGIKDDDDTEAVGLHDETFSGTICAMAIPPAVIALAGEIKTWVDTNGAVVDSPYTSESVIGVYSYTKKTGTGAGGTVSWQDTFKSRLDRWRRVSF